jgi:hypothetical protein
MAHTRQFQPVAPVVAASGRSRKDGSYEGPSEASPGVWGFPPGKMAHTKAERSKPGGLGVSPQERRKFGPAPFPCSFRMPS